jgi:hypothetical protein
VRQKQEWEKNGKILTSYFIISMKFMPLRTAMMMLLSKASSQQSCISCCKLSAT